MKLYTIFKVGEKEYKCRLTARASVDLEERLGSNPVNILLAAVNTNTMPSLKTLIYILHASLQSMEHDMSIDKVYELYDAWVDDGHSYEELLQVVIEIFTASGFIGENKNKVEENAKN